MLNDTCYAEKSTELSPEEKKNSYNHGRYSWERENLRFKKGKAKKVARVRMLQTKHKLSKNDYLRKHWKKIDIKNAKKRR